MRPTRLGWAALLLMWGCGAEVCGNLGGLKIQPRYQPYSPSEVFENGTVMQPQVQGTVATDADLLTGPAATGLDTDGKPLDRIPIPVDRALVERGRHHFEILCAACHGPLGDGKSPVAEAMALRPPPSLIDHAFAPGHVFQVATQGYGVMPSFAARIPARDRWGVAAFVAALRRSQRTPVDRAPPEVRKQLQEAP